MLGGDEDTTRYTQRPHLTSLLGRKIRYLLETFIPDFAPIMSYYIIRSIDVVA